MKPKVKKKPVVKMFDVKETTGWDLICHVCCYNFTIVSLTHAAREALYRAVYLLNDGYGIEGFVPPQGYDWSGVRDSSEKAHLKMEQMLRKWFEQNRIDYYVVEDRTNCR